MQNEYRLFTFVAHSYLSPLQCGIRTAHIVSELANACNSKTSNLTEGQILAFDDWAEFDKSIDVRGAFNHKGVLDCFNALKPFVDYFDLPAVLFTEDEDSMNSMATACGIIMPDCFYKSKHFPANSKYGRVSQPHYVWRKKGNSSETATQSNTTYVVGSLGYEFIDFIRSYHRV